MNGSRRIASPSAQARTPKLTILGWCQQPPAEATEICETTLRLERKADWYQRPGSRPRQSDRQLDAWRASSACGDAAVEVNNQIRGILKTCSIAMHLSA